MSEERDPRLQQLFGQTYEPLPAKQFTAEVMQHTHALKLRSFVRLGLLIVVVLSGSWYLYSDLLLQLMGILTQLLTAELLDLNVHWFGWMLAPVNTLGGLGALIFGIVRRFRKRISGLGYAG